MKQALVRVPNEWPECNDIKLGDCLRLLRTHHGRTIVSFDIVSIFANVPIDESLTIVRNKLEKYISA